MNKKGASEAFEFLVFVSSLLLSITLSYPTILFNDDWITANQLSQLDNGHQLLYSEGKYGAYENGTPYSYFTYRNNILEYTLFLPIISYYPLQFIKLIGNFYQFFIAAIFSFLLLVSGLLINQYYSESLGTYRRIGTIIIIGSIILYYFNMALARPLTISGPDANREILAVALTHQISFAFLGVFLYAIFLTITKENVISLVGTASSLLCSSYLFWASNLKDHIEATLIFTIIIYLTLKYYYHHKLIYVIFSFVMAGILIWIRPELGSPVSLIVFLTYIYYIYQHRQNWINGTRITLVYLFIIPFSILAGLVPFFITNYLVTGHPLITAFLYSSAHPELFQNSESITQNLSVTFYSHETTIESIFKIFLSRFNTSSQDIITDIYRVGLQPKIVSVPVFLVTPLFFLGLLTAPVLKIFGKLYLKKEELLAVGIAGLMAVSCFLSYISSIEGLISSRGMMPDIRYLVPMYVPLNIIGILLIRPLIQGFERLLIKTIVVVTTIGIPIIFYLLSKVLEIEPYEINIIINSNYLYVEYGIVLVTFILIGFYILGMITPRWVIIGIGCSIVFVFLWQFALIISLKLNPYWSGYPMILPIMDFLATNLLPHLVIP